MDVYISHLNYWYPNSDNLSIDQSVKMGDEEKEWPNLDFIPAMQRRRLSPFAKIALSVTHKTLANTTQSLPIIFSSRHGDLHKTSDLLADLVDENALSPTAFGLSVHNAIPSLFSILTTNKKAINAIAAGKDSFFMALIDAYSRLKSGVTDKILFIHADQKLPETYIAFKDELQISHAVSMLITLKPLINSDESLVSFSFKTQNTDNKEELPAALVFAKWFEDTTSKLIINSNQYKWSLSKSVTTG